MTYGPCYDPLFIVNKDETRWYLAESLEAVADDGCHYQMKLRDGMTWHDGEPITVDDVILFYQGAAGWVQCNRCQQCQI